MKKNVVFIACVVNKEKTNKYGSFDYFDYTIKTWEYWCKKNNCELVLFQEPYEKDTKKFRINWQKAVFIFDELERRNIDYNQILLLDSTCMIKWDCPNFFEMTDNKFTAIRDMDNLRWIHNSIEGYKEFFDGYECDIKQYVNSGFIIFNETHREFFESFKEMYLDNVDKLCELHDKTGTAEQTPLNYWIQIKNMEVNDSLPGMLYRCSHLHRKEMLAHNWQLNDDPTPFFIKYPYVWMFSGFAREHRTPLMQQTWDLVKHNYTFDEDEILLNSVRHKDKFRLSTSRKFKKDLINSFKSRKFKDMTMVELGCCQGDTTKIFSNLFKSVHAVDWQKENIDKTKEMCKDCNNITYQVANVTNDEWDFPKADVVFIDASHDYPQVAYDIEKAIDYFDNPIIILDDYGNPNNKNIRMSIEDKIKEGKITISEFIGEEAGFKTKSGWAMDDREGIICNYENR